MNKQARLFNPRHAAPVPSWTVHAVAAAAALATLSTAAWAQEAPKLEEVVVTAQKRATLASKTPVSLAVVTGDDLKAEGAADTKRLAELMPNVQIGNGSLGGVEISIRGIGSTNNSEVGDPAVGVSIDGVYLGRPQMAGAALYDVARVEVLRGPQGTLYGRNTTAGALNIITNKPKEVFEGSASVGLSNYAGKQADVMVNTPVNDRLALRAVVSAAKRKGYIETFAQDTQDAAKKSDQDNLSARLQGLVKVSPKTSLLLAADYSQNRGLGGGTVLPAVVQANPNGSAGRTLVTARYAGHNNENSSGVSGELKHDLGAAELTVIAARREQERDQVYSLVNSGTGAYLFSHFKQDSLEARLASTTSGPLQWVGGAFLFREKGAPIALGAFGPSTLFYQNPMITKSAAVFGQGTYAVAPSLRLTAGARFTKDDKSRKGCSYPFATLNAAGLGNLTTATNLPGSEPDAASLPACPTANLNDASVSYTKTTYRLGVDWDLDPRTLVYGSFATAFKAGGFNDGNVNTASNINAVVYKPENLKALEAGMKGRFLSGRLQTNVAAFLYDYSELQVSAITTCASGSGTCSVTQNAGKARSKGLELEGRYLLSSADRFNFGLGWTDAKYTSFATTSGASWDGHKLDKSPSVVANLGYSHQFALASGAAVTAFLGERYSSGYHVSNPAANLHVNQTAFHKTDAHVTYASADDKWSVQAYVRNIEDRNTITSYQAAGPVSGVYLAEPRVFGVRANLKF